MHLTPADQEKLLLSMAGLVAREPSRSVAPRSSSPRTERRLVRVLNGGDRPIQVGSHFHFADVNRALEFDRAAAAGFRLDVPAGSSVRFESGIERDVSLVALGGAGIVAGLHTRPRGR